MKIHGYLNADDKNKAIDELIEKLVILNIVKNHTLEK
jgi:hypothetical protein